jgi:ketopantoate reductase
MYVGRTNSLIRRLQMHGRGNPYSAALTMAMVKEMYFRIWHPNHTDTPMNDLWAIPAFYNMQTNQVMQNPDFQNVFGVAREQVENMEMQVVQIENQHEQAMFEIYAHVALGTPYNSFRTH